MAAYNGRIITDFHGTAGAGYQFERVRGEWKSKFSYTFENHFHPFVGELIERLNKGSIAGLLDADFHESLEEHFFKDIYDPNQSEPTVAVDYSPKVIDVQEGGAYAVYNWELLFHIPFIIAVHLSKNQRFAEAQRWFHYIFDPTARDGQFWRFLAFRQESALKGIDELLRVFAKPADESTDEELALKELIVSGYEAVRSNPFQPHAVARTRILAYQYSVVMKYLDNLIAWGDTLFRQDTIESLGEATQLYVLAANLLGPRPQRIPPRGKRRPLTFAKLRAGGLDELGNALIELEGEFPFNLYAPTTEGIDTDDVSPLFGLGHTLYFCIPRNEKLLAYWDTVADRLFKLRHCMNIEGIVRQLPLFDPPIDPGMLVKAAAAGIDISRLVSGLNQPLSPVRSRLLIQKAIEIAGEVRGMGAALLAALEKEDAEAMALLRQKHEITIQELSQEVRFLQWKEAEAATDALVKSREIALERYRFYKRLLGASDDDVSEAEDFSLDRSTTTLTEESFDDAYADLVEQYAQEAASEEYPGLDVFDEGRLYLNRNENKELNELMPTARLFEDMAYLNDVITAALYYIPNFKIDMSYWGIGGDTEIAGGKFLGNAGQAVSSSLRGLANYFAQDAASAAKKASYERRADDWMLQSNLAARELAHIGRQIITSLIREQIARHEYENHKAQIEQAKEVDAFLHDKFTSAELYGWMQGEISKLYYEYYKLAFDIARKAELTMKHELMRPELDDVNFIKFNYWDGGRKGLLSGEALQFDIRRLEMAYHDHNKREYELTKSISLGRLDPGALLGLKATGRCDVSLPEWLFDLDGAGHYMRRIKQVSLSIPAVTGPYTNLNCTVSLLKSTVRTSPLLRDDEYARSADEEDERFVDYYGTIQSIVTSHGQEDPGMFDVNLQDERFLPFEGAGVVSTWRLELPAEFRQFDYLTVSDVILHIRYTARPGGELLRKKAVGRIRELVASAETAGLARVFSLRHDFSTEWHRFVHGEENFQATVSKAHFPYFVHDETLTINQVELYAIDDEQLLSAVPSGIDADALTTALGNQERFELSLAEQVPVLSRSADAQVFVLVRYSLE